MYSSDKDTRETIKDGRRPAIESSTQAELLLIESRFGSKRFIKPVFYQSVTSGSPLEALLHGLCAVSGGQDANLLEVYVVRVDVLDFLRDHWLSAGPT